MTRKKRKKKALTHTVVVLKQQSGLDMETAE